jgi:hypothetical protein
MSSLPCLKIFLPRAVFAATLLTLMALPWSVQAEGVEATPGGLSNLRRLTTDQHSIAPVFSPTDANLIAFTKDKYQGIYLLHMRRSLSAEGAESVSVAAESEITPAQSLSGFGFSWTGTGEHIVFRNSEEDGAQAALVNVRTKETTLLSDKSAQVSVPTAHKQGIFFSRNAQGARLPLPGMRQSAANATPPIVEADGEIRVDGKSINPPGDICWLPRLSPDGLKLVMECWGGLYSYELKSAKLHFLDHGSSANWAVDSQRLAYEQTQDDGHRVTASEIFLINYNGSDKVLLSGDLDEIVRRPSLSPDNRQIAVDIGGDIYLADIVLSPAESP